MSRRPPVDRVQDTAMWVAMARALESERKDALFRDPLARRLAGTRGHELVGDLSARAGGTWPVVARTHLIDRLVLEAVKDGADAVLDLAAGLDTRPYRLELPPSLTWIEVDHEDMIAAKNEALAGEPARCEVERVALDLARATERRALFEHVAGRFGRVLVMTEGLLYYLPEDAVMSLVADLLLVNPFRWIADLHNRAVVAFLAKRTGDAFQGTARMQFARDDGPLAFEPLGWRTASAISLFKEAGRLKRLPFPMSLFARLPEPPYGAPGRPWAGVCVMEPTARV